MTRLHFTATLYMFLPTSLSKLQMALLPAPALRTTQPDQNIKQTIFSLKRLKYDGVRVVCCLPPNLGVLRVFRVKCWTRPAKLTHYVG